MKFTSTLTAALLAIGTVASLSAQEAPKPVEAAEAAPKFTEAQMMETFGWFVGRRMGLSELGFSAEQTDAIIKGIKLAATGAESPFKIDEVGPQLDAFMQIKQAEYTAKQAKKSAEASEKFFSEIKAKQGVMALPVETNEGPVTMFYEILKEGSGEYPKASNVVKVHYTGTLVDGTVFDSSVERGEPIEFPLGGVIKGWTEGVQKINKGGKIKLYIPYQLAYGAEGRPPTIPPAATLVFEVELLEFKDGPSAPAMDAPAAAEGM